MHILQNISSNDLYFQFLILGMCIMFIFFLLIILYVWLNQQRKQRLTSDYVTNQNHHQKKLLNLSIQKEENERLRFSQDLHDDVGAQLSASKMYIHSIIHASKDEVIKQRLESLSEMIDDSLLKIRQISRKITPPLLIELGLAKALEHYITELNLIDEIKISFYCESYQKHLSITEISFFRIVQEILNNTLKYSHANLIHVNIEGDEDQIVVEIFDDGVPFDIKERISSNTHHYHVGSGLKNIESRLQNLNALLYYDYEDNKNKVCIAYKKITLDD